MKVTVESVKQFTLDKGANLVGVAPVERFEGAPVGHHPTDILSGARSVVVCAKPIPVGAFDGPATSYQIAMDAAHQQLDLLATQVALFLEEGGGRAIPVPSDEPYQHWEAERSYGRGDLSHKHAAQAAGLGKLGKSSLLITPCPAGAIGEGQRVDQALCRPVVMQRLPKGRIIEGCWACRQACPVNSRKE